LFVVNSVGTNRSSLRDYVTFNSRKLHRSALRLLITIYTSLNPTYYLEFRLQRHLQRDDTAGRVARSLYAYMAAALQRRTGLLCTPPTSEFINMFPEPIKRNRNSIWHLGSPVRVAGRKFPRASIVSNCNTHIHTNARVRSV